MPGPVSSRLAGVERRLTTIGNEIALAGAKAVADSVSQQVAADGGPLSRYKGGGPIRVEGRAVGMDTAEVVPTSGAGQLAILNTGARPHQIGQRGRVLAFQGGGFASGVVRHPGAPGKQTFSRGVDRGQPRARNEAQRVFRTVIR